jgi:hypothetical protein
LLSGGPVEGEEVLERFVDMELESSLLGDLSRKLCEDELVPGRH